MWSHYADIYKGFCLEFDTNYEPFNKIEKVVYSKEMPRLNPLELLNNQGHKNILDLFKLKSEHWTYEKEWRVFHQKVNTPFCYQSKALTGVYIGPNMERELIEIICLILQGQNDDVKFYQGKKSQDEFKVIFEEFNYDSHLSAIEKGLK